MPRRLSNGIRAVLARLLLSSAGAGAIVGLACLGLTLSTQTEAVNLLFEPFSLLFLPGIAVVITWTTVSGHLQQHTRTLADNHDIPSSIVVWCTVLFYFALLYWLLDRRRRRAAFTDAAGSA